MDKTLINGGHRSLCIRAFLLALGLVSALACQPAMAEDDPFALDISQWKSFEHNADDAKRPQISNPTYPDIAESAPVVEAEKPAAAPAPTAEALAVAAPNRPIDLPVMPGLNKGFTVQVNSTEDERPGLVSTAAAAVPALPDIHTDAKNWVAPTAPKAGQVAEDDDEEKPLNVRMTYLPTPTPVPSPVATKDTAQHLAHLAIEKGLAMAKKEAPKSPAEQAACAAIDAYKQQQLDALKSDRATLKALQDAISSLGLDKQLSFMAGKGSDTLDAQGSRTAGGMDIPATAIR